ncbi:hypothetical protein V2S66_16610 [Streptomyces sp. V4-01]|uniref:Integral membrane protein n=1 Tax=Actinacidiphila polyblastidii TaxID=3110430 RepID=A0ABU7PCR0_9ACTN|nr:hypothetical protein [Streptomyces sp. V4-01]
MRRGIAVGTAVVLVLEALTIAGVNWILGLAVQHQEMSMGGLSHDAMATGSWVAGGVFGLFLVLCAVLVARIAWQERISGPFPRIVLVVCAVVHAVVGALVVGLVGWPAFFVMMVILGLLVATLLMYAPEDEPARRARPDRPADSGSGRPAEGELPTVPEQVQRPGRTPEHKGGDASSPAAPPATA